jgi:hypothetical protein
LKRLLNKYVTLLVRGSLRDNIVYKTQLLRLFLLYEQQQQKENNTVIKTEQYRCRVHNIESTETFLDYFPKI